MPRKLRTEEPENGDRWVVSYADFITLLFAFFTTMYAISHVDLGKLEQFSGSMKSAFKGGTIGTVDMTVIEGIKPANYDDIRLEGEIRERLTKFDIIESVSVTHNERGVVISFEDSVLFDSGLAQVRSDARPLLAMIAMLIRDRSNLIVIEGHTDNIPIRTGRYPSNWELSTARATAVLVHLINSHGLNPERFSAAGYGEFRPVAANATPAGRAKNRRVDILFLDERTGR